MLETFGFVGEIFLLIVEFFVELFLFDSWLDESEHQEKQSRRKSRKRKNK